MRVFKTGHDSRFDEAKHKPFTFWIYWTMQVGAGAAALGAEVPVAFTGVEVETHCIAQ